MHARSFVPPSCVYYVCIHSHSGMDNSIYMHHYMYSTCMCVLCTGYAVAQWLGLYLQLLGVVMVAGVSFLAVLEHHFSSVDPGTVQ